MPPPRYATSAAIARDTFGTSATPIRKAVIANGNDFPDAVMGANFLSGTFVPVRCWDDGASLKAEPASGRNQPQDNGARLAPSASLRVCVANCVL